MTEVLTQRTWSLLRDDAVRSIFRCPQCGSFFDVARQNRQTGSVARKCVPCDDWYPIVGARRSEPA